jgi:hypothetical protein
MGNPFGRNTFPRGRATGAGTPLVYYRRGMDKNDDEKSASTTPRAAGLFGLGVRQQPPAWDIRARAVVENLSIAAGHVLTVGVLAATAAVLMLKFHRLLRGRRGFPERACDCP